jgi:hypothetical protein
MRRARPTPPARTAFAFGEGMAAGPAPPPRHNQLRPAQPSWQCTPQPSCQVRHQHPLPICVITFAAPHVCNYICSTTYALHVRHYIRFAAVATPADTITMPGGPLSRSLSLSCSPASSCSKPAGRKVGRVTPLTPLTKALTDSPPAGTPLPDEAHQRVVVLPRVQHIHACSRHHQRLCRHSCHVICDT